MTATTEYPRGKAKLIRCKKCLFPLGYKIRRDGITRFRLQVPIGSQFVQVAEISGSAKITCWNCGMERRWLPGGVGEVEEPSEELTPTGRLWTQEDEERYG